MKEELNDDFEKKINSDKKQKEPEIINNGDNTLNNNIDEKLKSNISSNFSNQTQNIRNNINSNTNDISNEELNKNIIINDSFNKNNQDNINEKNINKIYSFSENINPIEKEFNDQNRENLFENKNINNKEENNINDVDFIILEKNRIGLSNKINKNELEKKENNKELMIEDEDIEDINNAIIDKEYSTENMEENNLYNNNIDKNNNNEEKMDLNTLENKEDNFNDENDNELINYKIISDSEKKDEKKEIGLNNELKDDLIKKIIKTKNDDNEVLELYSYEGNENNNKCDENENENEEYFINKQNNQINDKKLADIKINDKEETLIFKTGKKSANKEKNDINLNNEIRNTDIIRADRLNININDIELENDEERIISDEIFDQENEAKKPSDKELFNQKDAMKNLQSLIAQKELNNNKKEGEENKINKINPEKEKIIKKGIYSKNSKMIPYRKFQISKSNKTEKKNDLQLKLKTNKRNSFFAKSKTLEITEKNNNKINSRKSFNINIDSKTNNDGLKNKIENYYKTKYIPYNSYIHFFQKTTSKNKNKKNNTLKMEENKSLLNDKTQNNYDNSYDHVIYQKRNIGGHDFSMASTSRIYSKKGKIRRNTFSKYKSYPKENKFKETNLYKNKKKEKINIDINQLYTPINYTKKIPLTGLNKVKENNNIRNVNYENDNNEINIKNNNNFVKYRIRDNNNIDLLNSKTSINFKNRKKIICKNNNMDLSNDNINQNEYLQNINNSNYTKKDTKDFNFYKRNKDIYNTMKNFQINNRINRFNQSLPYMENQIKTKNKLNMNENYLDLEQNNLEEYEDNNYENNYYINNIANNISIDIEDLLVLDEKLNELIYFLKSIKDVKNQSFDFLNFLLYSSLNRLEKNFKNEKAIKIVKLSINLELLSAILCYEFSFDEVIIKKTYILLLEILEINHNSLISICQNILNKIQRENSKNIWLQLLYKIVSNSTNEDDNYYYYKTLPFYEKINSNNDKLIKKIKNVLFNYHTEKSSLISSLLKKIDQKNYDQINDFFQEYILRKENAFNTKNIQVNQVRPPFILSKRKKKFTLILSLDETLVHLQQINYSQCSVKLRPYLVEFLESVKPYYELILFTSKTTYYTIPVMKVLQRNKKYFDYIFYREHCIIIGNDYVKDLTRIGRSLDSTIIVDNLPQHFKLQKENGINIKSFWAQDPNDRALYDLIRILINIALEENDVRDGLEKYKEDIIGRITSNLYDYNLI